MAEKTRQEGVVADAEKGYTVKSYHNCEPVLDPKTGLPLLYKKGVGFKITNVGPKPVEYALEKLNVDGFGLGVPDLTTSRWVRPYETVILWKDDEDNKNDKCESNTCEVDDTICDGSKGREILLLNMDENSDPKYYTFADSYTPAVCCEEEAEVCAEECCEKGEIKVNTCETDVEGQACK